MSQTDFPMGVDPATIPPTIYPLLGVQKNFVGEVVRLSQSAMQLLAQGELTMASAKEFLLDPSSPGLITDDRLALHVDLTSVGDLQTVAAFVQAVRDLAEVNDGKVFNALVRVARNAGNVR